MADKLARDIQTILQVDTTFSAAVRVIAEYHDKKSLDQLYDSLMLRMNMLLVLEGAFDAFYVSQAIPTMPGELQAIDITDLIEAEDKTLLVARQDVKIRSPDDIRHMMRFMFPFCATVQKSVTPTRVFGWTAVVGAQNVLLYEERVPEYMVDSPPMHAMVYNRMHAIARVLLRIPEVEQVRGAINRPMGARNCYYAIDRETLREFDTFASRLPPPAQI